MATITSANSVAALTVPGLYDTPQRLQGYSTDASLGTDTINPVEVIMGVDGVMSTGYTPVPTPVTITLQADSPSMVVFENWDAAQTTAREAILANMTVTIPSTGRKYACTKGALTGVQRFPNGAKTLQPRVFTITFESVTPAAV